MSNETPSTNFPASRHTISQLKETATDAANDLASSATVHASKAKSQLKELAGHVQEEGGQKLDEIRGNLSDVVSSARSFASERPFACIGTALAVGFLFGLSRRFNSTR